MDDLSSLSLADIARLAEAARLPPVHSWNPERCGHSGMRIARDGSWYHDGEPIRRIDWPEPAGESRGSLLFVPGRGDAYEKYLELAPNGSYAAAIRSILEQLKREAAGEQIIP